MHSENPDNFILSKNSRNKPCNGKGKNIQCRYKGDSVHMKRGKGVHTVTVHCLQTCLAMAHEVLLNMGNTSDNECPAPSSGLGLPDNNLPVVVVTIYI